METDNLRLSESTYAILLAARNPLHGYGIMLRVKQMSAGRIVIGPGTMYGALKKLIADGWVSVESAGAQKLYTTTSVGLAAARQEFERLNLLVKMYGGERDA